MIYDLDDMTNHAHCNFLCETSMIEQPDCLKECFEHLSYGMLEMVLVLGFLVSLFVSILFLIGHVFDFIELYRIECEKETLKLLKKYK
jgi:hypothetical protein